MTTYLLSPILNGYQSFLATGLPNNGGLIYTYAAGTTTPQATYTTSVGNVPNANPIPLSTAGVPPNEIWITDGLAYKFIITDSTTSPIAGASYDNISSSYSFSSAALAAPSGSSLVGTIQPGGSATPTTIMQKINQTISLFDAMTSAQIADVIANTLTLDVTSASQTVLGWNTGKSYAPSGSYKLVTPSSNRACLYLANDNMALSGDGAATIMKVSTDIAVPVHVSTQIDLSNNTESSIVHNSLIEGLHIKGSAHYTNSALALGRGILLRGVAGAIVTKNFVQDMSMIGICSEGGANTETPAYLVTNNILKNNGYSSINFNGRCAYSIASNNICMGSSADANSSAIQSDGHAVLANNTVYGDVTNYALSGGIMWGEGNWTGMGVISNHLIKDCQFGIKSLYHGPVNIVGNTIINCRSTGGIVLIGGTTGGLTVPSSDNIVANNLLVNNSPDQISCNTNGTLITGNRCLYIASPVNPGGTTDSDYVTAIQPQHGIAISANNVSLIGNVISGALRGLFINQANFNNLGAVQGNEITGATAGAVCIESDSVPALVIATIPLFERTSNGGGDSGGSTVYFNKYFQSAKCTQGFWGAGDTWMRYPAVPGSSLGEVCTAVVSSATTAVQAVATATTITLSSTTGITNQAGNLVGVELDNHQYLWTNITNVAGAVITIANAIPAGRTANIGGRIYYMKWYPLANL